MKTPGIIARLFLYHQFLIVMKILLYLPAVLLALSACSRQPAGNQQTDSSASPDVSIIQDTDTICFERYSSLKKLDTASIMMIIEGSSVSGRYSNYPYQKDARIGTITGTKSGDLIKGVWRYQQEGMPDSIKVEFKLQDDKLLQKATSFDQNTGREVLTDTAAFSLVFDKLNCQSNDPRMRQK